MYLDYLELKVQVDTGNKLPEQKVYITNKLSTSIKRAQSLSGYRIQNALLPHVVNKNQKFCDDS